MPGRRDILDDYNLAAQKRIRRNEAIEEYNEEREANGDEPIKIRSLTPTEYMLSRNKGRHTVVYRGVEYKSYYSNADSARRAFTKLRRGEEGSTGERIYERGQQYVYQDKASGGFRTGRPKGLYQIGLWMILVTYIYTDEDGVQQGPVTKSFIVQDKYDRFDSMFSSGKMGMELDDAITDKMAEWSANKSDASEDYVVLDVEYQRIQTTTKTRSHIVAM